MTQGQPPRSKLSDAQLARALAAFRTVVGDRWVLDAEAERATYADPYAIGDDGRHSTPAAVAPASVDEVQAIVRLANDHRTPLWPVSRGKNLGYGGAAPQMAGSIVLDLGRMKKILDVDPVTAHCIVEPGVGFFDLYQHLTNTKTPLWMSVPGNGWGSVLGNALERGFGQYALGDHSSAICGIEAVLPDGSLVRTGMGAMAGNKTWPLFKNGYGPSWDQLFMQSNFGVVTKAGLWLQPEPDVSIKMSMALPRRDDIGWAVDLLNRLRLDGAVDHPVSIASYAVLAAMRTQRSEWYEGAGALPDEIISKIVAANGGGWWNFVIRAQGAEPIVEAKRQVIEAAFAAYTKTPFSLTHWRRGEAIEKSAAGVPSTLPLQVVNWHGGRGGHIDFSPVLPARGDLALKQLTRTRSRYAEFGLDFYGSYYVNGRSVTNINLIVYNRDDDAMTTKSIGLFKAMLADAKADGYAEYRTHLDFTDEVAGSFDFNNHALLTLNTRVKNLLDPRGILAPGKSGIWPRASQ